MKKQKPVAWLYIDQTNPHLFVHYDDVDRSQFPHDEWFPVYKQPKREWVGLTDKDILDALQPHYEEWEASELLDLSSEDYKLIEAKLKEKNGL